MDSLILQDPVENGVARLVMNADFNLNALSDAMIAALMATFDRLEADTEVRVVILAARGRAFCAGHDLKEMTQKRADKDGGRAAFCDLFQRCSALMLRLQTRPWPVIAEVHAVAAAAGCQLVAACDLALASHGARFGVNGVNIGLFCSTPMVALTRNIPRKKAFELLTTGDFLSAGDAENLGLINRAVPEATLKAETRAMAEKIATKQTRAIQMGKAAFYRQSEMPVADAYAWTGEVISENLMLEETRRAIDGFLEK